MSGFETDKIKKVKEALNTCTMCGFCKSVCPSFKSIGWDSAVSRGRIIQTYGLLTGQLEADDSVVENMYTCTTCADCSRRCPSTVDIVEIIELCRADLVKNGYILPKHKAIVDSILKYNNPYSEEKSVAETLGMKPRKAKIGYFAGCTATYREKKIAAASLSILKKLGEDFTTIDEVCCGSVLQRIGADEEKSIELMKKNVEAIKALGIETLILSCSGCYRMFKTEYPKFVDVPFEVLHMSEYLAKQDLKLKPLGNVKLTYHDPCHLGRHCKVYGPPREVLKKFPDLNFKEMKFNKASSHCCGGGGGVRSAYPEEAKDIASTRLDEANFADIIVTACPFCVANLVSAVGDRKVKIMDLTELVDAYL
ncbi:MAG: heterodisulfide reductase-related iron-sulfur binding cluster [Methanomassiliicoccaceae archaeon]|nr:heterodisulfide reductase-related iron-sulfur binding cluster [Methanomassiliicoccaceae archaeon]